jgi:hypothetical protein
MLRTGRLLCCGLFLASLCCPSAQAATFQISDYQFWLLPTQKNKELHIDGRIEGGAPCKALHLEIKLIGDKGGKGTVRTVVREAGGFGSRLIDGKIPSKAPGQNWEVDEVKLRCKER